VANQDQITCIDSYMIIYKFSPNLEIPSFPNKEILISNPSPKPQEKKIVKRGRKSKLTQKDEKQKSISDFFFQNKNKEETNARTNKKLEKDICDILFANIRSFRANKTALDIFIERHNPKISSRRDLDKSH